MNETNDLIRQLWDQLDWDSLGDCYCDEGGAAFWAANREPARGLGMQWAAALRKRLPREGRSLYVGAGVAELPALLSEVRRLRRSVVATNLLQLECDLLNRGLRSVSVSADELEFVCVDAREAAEPGGFDHLSMVSVFTDPDFWPTIGPATYGRIPPVVLDLGAFATEREQANAMIDRLCRGLGRPAFITTSIEEAPWFAHWAAANGHELLADDETIDTAVIGDPIGFLQLA